MSAFLKLQFAAVGFKVARIAVIAVHNGGLPLVAITLSLTPASYGLLKSLSLLSQLSYPVGNIADFALSCRLFILP